MYLLPALNSTWISRAALIYIPVPSNFTDSQMQVMLLVISWYLSSTLPKIVLIFPSPNLQHCLRRQAQNSNHHHQVHRRCSRSPTRISCRARCRILHRNINRYTRTLTRISRKRNHLIQVICRARSLHLLREGANESLVFAETRCLHITVVIPGSDG